MITTKLTRSKKIILLLVLLICLLIGAGVAIAWIRLNQAAQENSKVQDSTQLEDTQIVALDYIHNNDTEGGLSYFDQQISKSQDKAEKKRLLLDKSNFALQAGLPKDALDAAKQADVLSSDTGTTESMARSYEAMGDKAQALALYEKLIKNSNADDPGRPAWEEYIKDLQ